MMIRATRKSPHWQGSVFYLTVTAGLRNHPASGAVAARHSRSICLLHLGDVGNVDVIDALIEQIDEAAAIWNRKCTRCSATATGMPIRWPGMPIHSA
jgi:hypothetical protein